MIDKKRIFSRLPHFIQFPLAKAYCKRKMKWAQHLKTPSSLIFFITSRCNLRCNHCFYWKELNTKGSELSIDEISKIASSLKHPVSLALTGGEPFIREDLKEIIEAFHHGCGTREVGITTNGTLTGPIVETTRFVLESDYLSSLSVQISLDGLEKCHDNIRGAKGSFRKAISTIMKLKKLKAHYSGFQMKIALTVQKRNLPELKGFIEYLLPMNIPLCFNIVRGGGFGVFDLPSSVSSDFNPKDESDSFLSLNDIKTAYALLKKMSDSSSFHFWPFRQQKIWELSIQMLEENRSPISCYASAMESVLYSNGDVSFCELSKPFANIKGYGYNFAGLWKSDEADRMRKLLGKCFCIHGCNLTTGLTFEPEVVIKVLNEQRCRHTHCSEDIIGH
jgi:MoaA/NifB/PqqE/SkfB family radical SAM enzyme